MSIDETAIEAKVRVQFQKFMTELPELLKTDIRGKWIVYLDGVRASFYTEKEAMYYAVTTFGINDGFVVDSVEEKKDDAMPISKHHGDTREQAERYLLRRDACIRELDSEVTTLLVPNAFVRRMLFEAWEEETK